MLRRGNSVGGFLHGGGRSSEKWRRVRMAVCSRLLIKVSPTSVSSELNAAQSNDMRLSKVVVVGFFFCK